MKLTAIVLAMAFPVLAAAADVEPAGAPPRWSIGAGIAFEIVSPSLLVPGVSSPSAPGVRASLERRVGPASWLVFGVSGTFTSSDTDPAPSGSILYSPTDDGRETQGHVAVGLRRELTGASAPLTLSALVLGDVGGVYADEGWVPTVSGDEERQVTRGVLAGASAGFAVDRELTRGLAVRISSPLVLVGWAWTRTSMTGGAPTRHTRSFTAGVALAPSLEVRLAF